MDARGCFAASDLKPGIYNIEARAAGLAKWYVRTVRVDGATRLDIPLGSDSLDTVAGSGEVGIIRDVLPYGGSPRSLSGWWDRSDAVVRLRVEVSFGAKPWSQVVSTEFEALAIEVLKSSAAHGPTVPRFTFLQRFAGTWTDSKGRGWSSGMPPDKPYAVGSELIAFLWWDERDSRFASLSLALSVEDGRVYYDDRRFEGIVANGTPVEAVMATLRAMQRRQ